MVTRRAGLTVCRVVQRVNLYIWATLLCLLTSIILSHIRSPAGYCFVDFGDYTVSQKVMTKLSGLPIPGSNPVCILVFIKKVKALSAS